MIGQIVGSQGKVDHLITQVQYAAEKKELIATVNNILQKHELVDLKLDNVVDIGMFFSRKALMLFGSFAQNQIEQYVSALKEIEKTTGITKVRKYLHEWVDGDRIRVSSNIRLGGK